jgi:hypothetical protein
LDKKKSSFFVAPKDVVVVVTDRRTDARFDRSETMMDDGARVFGFAASTIASMAMVGKPVTTTTTMKMPTSVSFVSSRWFPAPFPGVSCESALRTAYPDDADKVYVIERKTVASQLTPSSCAWRAFRCGVVAYQRPVSEWLDEVQRAIENEREGEEPAPLPEFDYVEPTREMVRRFVRETVVAVTRRSIEKVLVSASSQRLSAKLCKDIKYSARRKAMRVSWERGLGKFAQSANMLRTTALASAVNVAGEWTVDASLATYYSAKAHYSKGYKRSAAFRAWRRAILSATCKAGCVLLGGATATALFALCRPRGAPAPVVTWGTLGALTLGELGGVMCAPLAVRAVDNAICLVLPPGAGGDEAADEKEKEEEKKKQK